MKRTYKIVLRLLPVLTCLLLSCNNNNEDVFPQSDVPVQLSVADISLWDFQPSALTSRAAGPLTGFFNTPIHLAYGEDASTFSEYGLALNGTVNNNITSFTPLLFYPSTNKIYMKGFYPRAESLTDGTYLTKPGPMIPTTGPDAGIIAYTIDGTYDIMVSNQVSGSTATPIATQLRFVHLLTRLSFVLYSDGTFPSSARVKQIKINNVLTEVELDLLNILDFNPLSPNPTAYPLTFATGALTTITSTLPGDGAVVSAIEGVGVKPAAVGNVMVEPGAESVYNVSVVVSMADPASPTGRVEEEYPVGSLTFSDTPTKAGYHYEIALTFNTFASIPSVTAAPTVVTPPAPTSPTWGTKYW